ncbi:hypothetical protein GPALN_004546 [Globodera pallida]|nr:hypothetical protein GPALN_004546 [Globodera pallida]
MDILWKRMPRQWRRPLKILAYNLLITQLCGIVEQLALAQHLIKAEDGRAKTLSLGAISESCFRHDSGEDLASENSQFTDLASTDTDPYSRHFKTGPVERKYRYNLTSGKSNTNKMTDMDDFKAKMDDLSRKMEGELSSSGNNKDGRTDGRPNCQNRDEIVRKQFSVHIWNPKIFGVRQRKTICGQNL